METHDSDIDRQCADYHRLENEITDLKQQRDDLLEALKQISDIEDARFTHAGFDLEVNNIAKVAIAKVS